MAVTASRLAGSGLIRLSPPPGLTAAVDLTVLPGDRERALSQADRCSGEAGRRLAARVDSSGVG